MPTRRSVCRATCSTACRTTTKEGVSGKSVVRLMISLRPTSSSCCVLKSLRTTHPSSTRSSSTSRVSASVIPYSSLTRLRLLRSWLAILIETMLRLPGETYSICASHWLRTCVTRSTPNSCMRSYLRRLRCLMLTTLSSWRKSSSSSLLHSNIWSSLSKKTSRPCSRYSLSF